MKIVQINEVSLAYERRGTGLPMLLVHGFPLDHTTWDALAACLDEDFDLILPDLRGFGQSNAPASATTVEQMAADLAGLLDVLNIQQVYIVGHSMGGYVTLAFAKAYPERVLGIGLIGSQAAPDNAERKAGRYATARQVDENGVSAVAGMADKLSNNPRLAPFFKEIILRQRTTGLISALFAMAERPDVAQVLKFYKKPIVLVHGLADALIPNERSREIKTMLPQAMLTELPDVGHSPAVEAPSETAKALRYLLSM